MEKVMGVDYFINKFEAIPEEQWCVDVFSNGKGAHCANGHCGAGCAGTTTESRAFQKVIFPLTDKAIMCPQDLHNEDEGYSVTAAKINNGSDSRYRQSSPRQRVLAALYDLKAMKALDEARAIVAEDRKVAEVEMV